MNYAERNRKGELRCMRCEGEEADRVWRLRRTESEKGKRVRMRVDGWEGICVCVCVCEWECEWEWKWESKNEWRERERVIDEMKMKRERCKKKRDEMFLHFICGPSFMAVGTKRPSLSIAYAYKHIHTRTHTHERERIIPYHTLPWVCWTTDSKRLCVFIQGCAKALNCASMSPLSKISSRPFSPTYHRAHPFFLSASLFSFLFIRILFVSLTSLSPTYTKHRPIDTSTQQHAHSLTRPTLFSYKWPAFGITIRFLDH